MARHEALAGAARRPAAAVARVMMANSGPDKRKRGWTAWGLRQNAADRPALVKGVLRAAGLVFAIAAVVGASYGMRWLEDTVRFSPDHEAPAQIRLINVPDDLHEEMAEALEPFADVPWSASALCTDIAARLETVAWVKEVVLVRRFPDHRIEVQCKYRNPLALVQINNVFYLVDDEGVLLPGRYAYDPALKLIQGVAVPPPEPGEKWEAPDLAAGLRLVDVLEREDFGQQITAVRVHNFGGRQDARAAHLELATDRNGGRIIWGSPVGEEIEENTAEQKIAILRANLRRFGRVDANRGVIDISVHPDRINTPA